MCVTPAASRAGPNRWNASSQTAKSLMRCSMCKIAMSTSLPRSSRIAHPNFLGVAGTRLRLVDTDHPALRRTIAECCASTLADRPFRAEVLESVRSVIPFDGYVWVLTDPASSVGVSPLASLPGLDLRRLPGIIGAKYRTTVNRWTALPVDGCARLADGDPSRSELWRSTVGELAVVDIMSAVLRDRFGCWAFLDLWRCGDEPFSEADEAFLRSLLAGLTTAQRQRVAQMFGSAGRAAHPDEPALVLLDDELAAVSSTAAAEQSFRRLLPTEPGNSPIPAAALNVAAQLLAREADVDHGPARSRAHLHDGRWVMLQAARLRHVTEGLSASIAVTVDPIGPIDRIDVFARAHGFTPRETDVIVKLAGGGSTRLVARELRVSEYTLQDHLKAMFAKTATSSRAELIARATGTP